MRKLKEFSKGHFFDKKKKNNEVRISFKKWATILLLLIIGHIVEMYILPYRFMRYFNSAVLMTFGIFMFYEMYPDILEIFCEFKEIFKKR